MRIRDLIQFALIAVIFSGCDDKRQAEQDIRPSFNGTDRAGQFVIISETLSDTGTKGTPEAGGEKIYVQILKARIITHAEFAEYEFAIIEVKTEDKNWHPLFRSKNGTIYTFSSIKLRLQSLHGDLSFKIEDFTNLKETIQPDGSGQ
tara:strand:- start:25 stop:465 length:441 start_codon:yes stop_codon:yes gene_type:complete